MNHRRISFIVIIMLSVSSLVGFALQRTSADASNGIELSLEVTPTTVHLGELLLVESRIKNNGSVPIFLEGDSNYAIFFKIAFKEDKDYKQYVPEGPLVSQEAYPDTRINPRESYIKQNRILWNRNFSSEVRNLSKEAAASYIDGRITSEYAFQEAGTYFIKAVTRIVKNKQIVLLESEPIKVTVIEPEAEDLEVWNKIKNNGDFAYFIQEGDIRIPGYKPEEREKFLREIEQIISDYPDSFYAESFRQSLAKFRATEEKKLEYLRKIQKSH